MAVHRIKDVWQTEIYTGKPLEPQHSSFDVKIAMEKLKRCKVPNTDQSMTEMIYKGGIQYNLRSTNIFILFEIRKNCHSSGKNVLFYLVIRRVIKVTSNYQGISLLPTTQIVSNILVCRRNYSGSSVWILM